MCRAAIARSSADIASLYIVSSLSLVYVGGSSTGVSAIGGSLASYSSTTIIVDAFFLVAFLILLDIIWSLPIRGTIFHNTVQQTP